jgi:hypothetical protein
MDDVVQVDAALRSLGRHSSPADRTKALKTLVEYWHGKMTPSDGLPESQLAGGPLPRSLYWWYSWAGRRQEITCGQDTLLQPGEVSQVDNGRLVEFWVENQGVYARATLPSGDDPPVFQSDWNHEGRWRQEDLSVLEFLIQVCIHEAITNAKYGAFVDIEEFQLSELSKLVPRLNIAPWRPWLEDQDPADTWGYMDFYVGRGLLAQTNDLGCSAAGVRGNTLSVAAKTKEAFTQLDEVIGPKGWEHRTF